MVVKIICGLLATVLMVIFTGAVAVKLKEVSLFIVILIGIGLMLVDMWFSLRSKDD